MTKKINQIANELDIKQSNVMFFGDEIAKIEPILQANKKNKLIVVTSINPTQAGEGKTTLSIGLVDLLNKHNVKAVAALREPSIGPLFGLKGGAIGGGRSQLYPGDKINLHFTGDFYAIMTANNLICTILENEIYFKTDLNIDPNKILWKRCLDANDRGIRNITVTITKDIKYDTNINITAASDLMSLFCLSNSKEDFKKTLEDTIVAYSVDNKPITVKQLEISNTILQIMDLCFKPNLVQTLYGNPAIISGGPFANISIGCNSIIATKTALNYGDITITECGFGSDLGFEKFMNIKMRRASLYPNAVVVCTTIKAMVMHGEYDSENNFLENGFKNLIQHVNNVRNYDIEPLVVLNINKQDTNEDITKFKELAVKHKINYAISNIFEEGLDNQNDLFNKVMDSIKEYPPKFLYSLDDKPLNKIEKICKNTYGTTDLVVPNKVQKELENPLIQKYAVCIAKTHCSLTSDPKKLNVPKNIVTNVDSISLNHAAKMIVVNCQKIIKMPGLPLVPNAKKMNKK